MKKSMIFLLLGILLIGVSLFLLGGALVGWDVLGWFTSNTAMLIYLIALILGFSMIVLWYRGSGK